MSEETDPPKQLAESAAEPELNPSSYYRASEIVFVLAAVTRLALFQFPAVTDTLGSRVELVTPITSFKRLTEGVYLFQNGIPPYDGGVFHQAPLFLALFSIISYLPRLSVTLIYTAADLGIAYLLQDITREKQRLYRDLPRVEDAEVKNGVREREVEPWIVAGLYLFNPFTIATCLSRSTILFVNLAVVLAVYYAFKANKTYATFWIATAAYTSFHPLTLVPPIIFILRQAKGSTSWTKADNVQCVGLLSAWLTGLLLLSYILVGSWDFLSASYGVILLLPDLTPNIGLWWYFFIEMFDQFRSFFLVVFNFHALTFAAPLTIKFKDHPLFAVFLLSGISAVFKSYPAVGDAALYIAFLPIYSEIIKYMRYNFLTTNIFLYSSVLAPIFYHLWIYAGSGNANFFYAITLVYSIGNIILLIDATYAMLRREFDVCHPECHGREVLRR